MSIWSTGRWPIEVKFYLLMALLRPWILRGRVLPLIGFALFAILVAAARQHGLIGGRDRARRRADGDRFMLIGVVFHYHGTGRLSSGRGIVAGTLLTGLFVFCWVIGPDRVEFPRLTANYIYGLALFWLCYAARDRFRPMIVLDTIADLSYPLYLIHSIIGFSVITLLIVEFGLGYGVAALIGFGFVLGGCLGDASCGRTPEPECRKTPGSAADAPHRGGRRAGRMTARRQSSGKTEFPAP